MCYFRSFTRQNFSLTLYGYPAKKNDADQIEHGARKIARVYKQVHQQEEKVLHGTALRVFAELQATMIVPGKLRRYYLVSKSSYEWESTLLLLCKSTNLLCEEEINSKKKHIIDGKLVKQYHRLDSLSHLSSNIIV